MAIGTLTAFEVAQIGAAAVAAGTAASSAAQQQKAAEKQEKLTKNVNAAKRVSATRESVREERVKRAAILQASEAQGVEGSSAEIGALGELSQNVALRTGAQAQETAFAAEQSSINRDVTRAQTTAQAGQVAGQLATTAFKFQ